ncbi:hypothetical protein D3C72_1241540 [compost metagenome]
MWVVILDALFPAAAPGRRTRWQHHLLDRSATGAGGRDVGTADKTQIGMIEVLAVQIVDHCAGRACADKRIEVGILVVKQRYTAVHLIGVVLADHAFTGHRIVRFANAGQQQQANVMQLESTEDHQIGRLFHLLPLGVDVGDAGGFLAGAVQIHFDYLRLGAQLKVFALGQYRQNGGLRRSLGVHKAAEALAVAAKITGT